jgi:YesN/AraC family two-component response regulator
MIKQDSCILIVDDMKMVRGVVRRYLAALGYQNLIEAENGAEAVKKAQDNKVDFIFMDVVMPIMTGMSALKKIRELGNNVPVAMLSSVADQKAIDDCMLLGIVDYVLKPLNAETGPGILKKALEKASFAH